jgi:hypothetical protein
MFILTTAHADTFTEPTEVVNCTPVTCTPIPEIIVPVTIFADTPVNDTLTSTITDSFPNVIVNKFVLTLISAFAVVKTFPVNERVSS